MRVPDSFRRYMPQLEAELRAVLGEGGSPLYTMMRYHLGWVDQSGQDQQSPGKLSRPTLCLLACEATGGQWPSALPAAAAVELIHNFSLIHDDIQDSSWERRNRPTVWKLWGEAQAINAGDAMYVLAQLALFRLEERGVPPHMVVLLSRHLNRASLQLCEGQYLDIEYERHLDISVDGYLDMIEKKTASLFECSLRFGAMLGTDSQAQISSLCSFGRNLGMAYQVENDLQGVRSKGRNGSDPPYTDIRGRKKILPVIHALHSAADRDQEGLRRIYGRSALSDQDVGRVLHILEGTGSRAYAETVRDRYYQQSLSDLERAGLPSSPRRALAEVAAFLLGQEVD
jgi:geranylgeranyl diphosphate synthase type I